jgi:aryl-alcohol dehydrogenase-like predicted oxidoreductase
MNYRLLGHSGLRVSELSLGTMTFGEDWGWGASKDESKKIYDAFRDAGGNFIDTANVYTNGSSERMLGEFASGHRDEVVLATKYTNADPGRDPNAAGNHRKNMLQALHGSLKRLQTDYIDLYWVHIWDQITPMEEVMRALDDVVRQGKVLHVGISNAPAWWVARANTFADLKGWSPFVGLQIEYSLVERSVERELIPMAKALNLAVVAWSPLSGGALTGKYSQPQPAKDSRYSTEFMRDFLPDPTRQERAVSALQRVSSEAGISPAQVALAWLRYRSVPVIPILGARRLSQFQDNLASLAVTLTPQQVNTLSDATQPELGFPDSFYQRKVVRAVVSGGLRDRILA